MPSGGSSSLSEGNCLATRRSAWAVAGRTAGGAAATGVERLRSWAGIGLAVHLRESVRRPPERGREAESGREAERGREMESREPPGAARHRFMWMGSEAEPNSRWQNGQGRMRGRPFMGAPAAVDPGQDAGCPRSPRAPPRTQAATRRSSTCDLIEGRVKKPPATSHPTRTPHRAAHPTPHRGTRADRLVYDVPCPPSTSPFPARGASLPVHTEPHRARHGGLPQSASSDASRSSRTSSEVAHLPRPLSHQDTTPARVMSDREGRLSRRYFRE